MEEQKSFVLVERNKVVHTVKTLKSVHSNFLHEQSAMKDKKLPLLNEAEDMPIMLQVTMKRIPKFKNILMIKIPLNHSLITNTTEVCLITGDLDKRDKKAEIEPTVLHFREMLQKHKIKGINEIIPLRQLRTDYKPFEAKRKLVAGYDVFLADDKIASCLPKALGKFFFQQHKFPQQIDFGRANLKDQIENALSRTILFLTGRGSSCCTSVAYLDWPVTKITDNIMVAIKILGEKLPGSFDNIHGLHLKLGRSTALPLYMSFESGNDVKLPSKKIIEDVEPEEISTLQKLKAKVFKSGEIELMLDEEYVASEDDSDREMKLLSEQNKRQKRKFKRKKFAEEKMNEKPTVVSVQDIKTIKRRKSTVEKAMVKPELNDENESSESSGGEYVVKLLPEPRKKQKKDILKIAAGIKNEKKTTEKEDIKPSKRRKSTVEKAMVKPELHDENESSESSDGEYGVKLLPEPSSSKTQKKNILKIAAGIGNKMKTTMEKEDIKPSKKKMESVQDIKTSKRRKSTVEKAVVKLELNDENESSESSDGEYRVKLLPEPSRSKKQKKSIVKIAAGMDSEIKTTKRKGIKPSKKKMMK